MRSGFFDNTTVWAEDFAKFAGGILTNGVLADVETALLVTAPASGMSVNVNAGYAWINGHFGHNEEISSVTIDMSDGTNPRIDRIVARLNFTEKEISLAVIKGEAAASPVAPDIVRNSNIYDLGLATVSIPAGTISITSTMISDTRRDSTVCGGVYPRTSEEFIYPGANNIGDIKMTACSNAPSKWMICDGSALSRTTYIDLFSAIGTTYGAGDGSTTFNIPDLRGKTVFGKSASGTFNTLGNTGGAETHRLTVSELAAHKHDNTISITPIKVYSSSGGSITPGVSSVTSDRDGYNTSYEVSATLTNANAGGNTPFNILPPYITLNYIIYTGVE